MTDERMSYEFLLWIVHRMVHKRQFLKSELYEIIQQIGTESWDELEVLSRKFRK